RRVHTWSWGQCNDRRRPNQGRRQVANGDTDPAGVSGHVPPEIQANLDRLLELLSTEEPGDILMRAEIQRELGRFEDACTTLSAALPERFETVRRQILSLCHVGDARVQQVGQQSSANKGPNIRS